MRLAFIALLCLAVGMFCGCAIFSNTAAQEAAATLSGEGATYAGLTAIQYSDPASIPQAETDIHDLSNTLKTLVQGSVDVNSVILTLNDFKISVDLIPAAYQPIVTALLGVIPSSVNVPTQAIPAQYITLIRDFLTGVDLGLQEYIAANPLPAPTPVPPPQAKLARVTTLDPLHRFVNGRK
jgi:hypothetical protein